uniref:box C/D snoRNA protein 1 n=1 Tax=Oncorhynchus gorbuscha TaxID=8017 RepID=UPI001EAF0A9C|nr:box C/D snoRNA protein 1 [Oncorhynchus gorbuscha]
MLTSMLSSVDTVAAAESHVENDRLGDELKGNKIKLSLANCGVCGSEVANYRCPGCLKHSCSLPCVKKHKEESGCSGVRDKTAFVALSKMDEMNLLSDYRFLEDTGRLADSANRDSLVRGPPVNFRAKRLTAQARRLNITLRFLPNTFTKSRENSTICLKKENRFLWHLQLLFPQSSSEFTERRVSDDQTLEQILTPYIHPTESEPVRRQKLKMYVHSPFDHIRVFMKAEGRKANSVRYQELDVAKTLKENLKFKLVIEYPLLHIVLKDHCHDYPLKGPVEPVLAHGSPMMEGAWRGNGRREEGRMEVSQPQLGPPFLGSSPETDPPKKKRAKREPEELEDGEIGDGDDDIEADKMVKEIVVAHGDEMPIDGFHGDCQVDDNPNYGNNHVDTHSGGCCIGDAMIAATETVDDKIRGDPESKAMSQNLHSVNLLSHFPVNNNDSINIDHGANGNDTGFDVSKK